MARNFTRDHFTWLAYLLLAFYAYFLNILGPITPFIKAELRLSYTVSSLHFTAFAVGILLVGLVGHHLIRRLGRWRSLWLGAAGMSLGALILLSGKSPVVTIGASFMMGLVGSLILAIVPSALSDWHGDLRAAAISESNVIAAVVSTAAPLMVGLFAHLASGWRLALGIAAFTPLLIRLAFWKVIPNNSTSENQEPALSRKPLPLRYWFFWLALVLVVSVEFCMIFWSADYLENGLGMPKANAAQAVSFFLAAMIIGRLAGSRLAQRFSEYKLFSVSILVAGAGFVIFWTANSVLSGLVGLFITGLGVASLYPLILALAIGAASENAVQASARATLASGTAILALPLFLGRLADAVGIQSAYGIVALLLVGAFLMVQITSRLSFSSQPALEKTH